MQLLALLKNYKAQCPLRWRLSWGGKSNSFISDCFKVLTLETPFLTENITLSTIIHLYCLKLILLTLITLQARTDRNRTHYTLYVCVIFHSFILSGENCRQTNCEYLFFFFFYFFPTFLHFHSFTLAFTWQTSLKGGWGLKALFKGFNGSPEVLEINNLNNYPIPTSLTFKHFNGVYLHAVINAVFRKQLQDDG